MSGNGFDKYKCAMVTGFIHSHPAAPPIFLGAYAIRDGVNKDGLEMPTFVQVQAQRLVVHVPMYQC